MKKYIYTLAAALLLVACTEDTMDSINERTDYPENDAVPARFQLTDAIMATAYYASSGDYAYYASTLTEQECGTGNNQFMKAELRNSSELASSTCFNNAWNSIYANLYNIKEMERKIQNGVSGNVGQYDVLGMAQVLEAVNIGVLTDMHGDVPYSEACQGLSNTTPKLDKQKDIYAAIINTLDSAIANFNKAADQELNNAGSQDITFSGDVSKWLATAYALKARYYIHQTAVDQSAIAKAEEAAQKAYDLNFTGFSVGGFDGNNNINPWTAFVWSRSYTAISKTTADLMTEDDPRYEHYVYKNAPKIYYTYYGVTEGTIMTPGDSELAGDASGALLFPEWYDNGTQAAHIMSLSELYFILAEAQLRLGKDATDAFKIAVSNSVYEICEMCGDANSATANAYADSLGTPDLKMLFEQKYIAQCNDEQVETYNDIRRCKAMGETWITLTNPYNTQSGINRWPERFPYGNSGVISNPNVAAAFGDGYYIYTKKTWINGGE